MKARERVVIEVPHGKVSKVMIGKVLFGLFLFYFFCYNYTEPTELGIARNRVTGSMWTQTGGYHFSWPWVSVITVDLRPIKVGVPSAGRAFSQKLVQFDPAGWQEFIAVEGFHYYWFANRLSFNWGHKDEYRGMKDILRGHAYGSKQYSFLKILSEEQ